MSKHSFLATTLIAYLCMCAWQKIYPHTSIWVAVKHLLLSLHGYFSVLTNRNNGSNDFLLLFIKMAFWSEMTPTLKLKWLLKRDISREVEQSCCMSRWTSSPVFSHIRQRERQALSVSPKTWSSSSCCPSAPAWLWTPALSRVPAVNIHQ